MPAPSVAHPAMPIDRSLGGMLARIARLHPERCALRWLDPAWPTAAPIEITFDQLATHTQATAYHLRTAHGIRQGDRVAWLGLNHPAQMVLLFAVARLGAMLVPLNHRLAPAEWQAVLSDCSPRLLVHDTTLRDAAQALAQETDLPCIAANAFPEQPTSTDPTTDQGTDGAWNSPALLVYTSGTTGLPKAAVHTQGNLLSNMAIAAQAQGMSERDTVLTVLPLFHVGGLCIQTLPALSRGATVLLHARFDAGATLHALEHQRPTLTLQVPATL
ncbi:MAG: AMP-binding protein, partial [Hydrogenophaga sp.]